jgi:hypothetical protein
VERNGTGFATTGLPARCLTHPKQEIPQMQTPRLLSPNAAIMAAALFVLPISP